MGGQHCITWFGGGVTNFTQAIFEVGGGTPFREKISRCARIFPSILLFFPHLINYVAVCKQYTTILSINVYLYKSFSIDVKCKQHRETHTHFSMWGGVVRRTQNWGGRVRRTQIWGGVVCRTQKWGGPTCGRRPHKSGHPPPLGMFLAASLS